MVSRKNKFLDLDNKPRRGRPPKDKLIPAMFDIKSLDLICSYIVISNPNIRRSNLINLRNYFSKIDINESSGNDKERLMRYEFIKKGIEARLEKNYKDTDIILSYINGGLSNPPLIPNLNLKNLSDNEIKWINDRVIVSLRTYGLECNINDLIASCTEFKTVDYNKKDEAANSLISNITNLNTLLRRSKDIDDVNEGIFSLSKGQFEDKIIEIHNNLSSPTNKLKCGIQGLNKLLNGGFQSERVYCFFGLPGEGKSITLLNLLYQIKLYNRNYRCKDPNKIPCVVLLTMENSLSETVNRLSSAILGTSLEEVADINEFIDKARHTKYFEVSPDNPIDIAIKFVPGYTESTNVMYDIYDELMESGKEPICFIVDYLKRIRSIDTIHNEIRLELGNVVNEMKVFAQDKNIPVITASQINRNGISQIDERRKHNGSDNVMEMSRGDIGESLLILENIDAGIYILPEIGSNDHKKYMGFKLGKSRTRAGSIAFFYQPFKDGNSVALEEDEGLPFAKFKTTMKVDINPNTPLFNNSTSVGFNTYASSYGLTNANTLNKEINSIDQEDNTFSNMPVMENSINIPSVGYEPEYRVLARKIELRDFIRMKK